MSVRIECAVEVDAPPQAAWDLLVDWPRQQEWMLLTHVEGGHGPGARVRAATGVGALSVVDTMEVTGWEPPWRCLVRHTGRVVRGTGAFVVEPLPRDRSRFVWSEELDLPIGALGRAGWVVVEPLMRAGVEHSLRRFAALAAAPR